MIEIYDKTENIFGCLAHENGRMDLFSNFNTCYIIYCDLNTMLHIHIKAINHVTKLHDMN